MLYLKDEHKIVYNTLKTFVIDHPLDPENKYLVHACLEGPEAGVYYRGRGEITNHRGCRIHLPPYACAVASDFSVHLTPILGKESTPLGSVRVYYASEVEDNYFDVVGDNGRFFWIVHGQRHAVQTDVDKASFKLEGSGPYQWLS
jgi:hypothetical protein